MTESPSFVARENLRMINAVFEKTGDFESSWLGWYTENPEHALRPYFKGGKETGVECKLRRTHAGFWFDWYRIVKGRVEGSGNWVVTYDFDGYEQGIFLLPILKYPDENLVTRIAEFQVWSALDPSSFSECLDENRGMLLEVFNRRHIAEAASHYDHLGNHNGKGPGFELG